MNKTPLHAAHKTAGAKLVDFFGWEMPLNYGSQLEEHHQVRQDAGMFDVSHMTVVDVTGSQARDYLRHLLANDVARLKLPGKALYSGMLNETGGVIDDLIVYFLTDEFYRLVVNSATREKDIAWLQQHTDGFDVTLKERSDLAMIAVQGPKVAARLQRVLTPEQMADASALKPFFGVQSGDLFIASTGYTGEAGYEILLPAERAAGLWQVMLDAGIKPCGLGARDTLRLEAGMNLYGQDMDEHTSPLAANMGWTIAWEPAERDFVGRQALEAQKAAGTDKLIGVLLESKGVLRAHQELQVTDIQGNTHKGEITSGTFSPTLGQGIGLARIPDVEIAEIQVAMRKKWITVKPVKPCFVRHGQSVVADLV